MSVGEPPPGSSLVKPRRPTQRSGASPPQVSQHVVPLHCPGHNRVLGVCMCQSVLQAQHRQTASNVVSLSAAPFFPAPAVSVATKVQVSSAVREQPAVRAAGATYLRLTGPQAVRKQILAAKAELAQLQAPCSLPENSRFYQHSMSEWLSSTAWVLGRPPVREVSQRPEGRWFRTPSLGEALVICELPVTGHIWPTPTWREFMTNSHTHLSLTLSPRKEPLHSMLRKAVRSVFVRHRPSQS